MNEDLRRTMAIRNFTRCFHELRKYEDLGYHAKTGLYIETMIEVCRYNGERKVRILKITEEDETMAYKKAASILLNRLNQIKEGGNMQMEAYKLHLKRCSGDKCLTCRDGTIIITVPKFEAISKTLSSLNHQEFNLQLISPYCPACGRPIKKRKTGTK